MAVRAVIGGRAMPMSAVAVRVARGSIILVTMPSRHARIPMRRGGRGTLMVDATITAEGKRRLGRRKDRRAKKHEPE
ncbi:MAG: hypothetical protein HYV19_04775 [Gemmatimonadetes bacterium]|nr:hypothetical protein [Gemmatimonadota bacterium]